MCVLCCHKRSTITVCGECKEHYCRQCIDTHTSALVGIILFIKDILSGIVCC